MNYTPISLSYDYQTPEYGLRGPVVDGLLIARRIVFNQDISDLHDEVMILRNIDNRIQEAKAAYAQGARH